MSYYYYIEGVMENLNQSITELYQLQKCFRKFDPFEIQMVRKLIDKVIAKINTQDKNQMQQDPSNNQQQKINILSVILFDEKLSVAYNQFLNCLIQKRKMLSTINQDIVNLDSLEKQASLLTQDRDILKVNINNLVRQNNQQNQLLRLCKLYDYILDVDDFFMSKLQFQRQFNIKNIIPFYSNEQCSGFISLINLGIIKKVSKNFDKIVQLVPNKEYIGKNINFIQPEYLAKQHDNILRNCIQSKVISNQITNFPLLVGKDKNNWAVPYNIKMQITMIGLEDFGVCGIIQQIKDSSYYVMATADLGFKSIIMSQQFYQKIFSNCYRPIELNNIKLANVIPIFENMFAHNSHGQEFQTIMIKPLIKEQIKSPFQIENNPLIFQQLMDIDICLIQGKYIRIQNPFVSFIYIVIFSCEPLVYLNTKKDALKDFRREIQKYLSNEEYYSDINLDYIQPEFSVGSMMREEQEDHQKSHFYNLTKLTMFKQRLQNVTYASRLQKIIKQNKLKIKQMYKYQQELALQHSQSSDLNFKNSDFDNQFSKIDEIQEIEACNLSTINNSNYLRHSSNNLLLTNRKSSQADQESLIQQNSKSSGWKNVLYGIEQLIFDSQKQDKLIYAEKKMRQLKNKNFLLNNVPGQVNKQADLQEIIKEEMNQDSDSSIDVSEMLQQNQKKEKFAEGSVNNSIGKNKQLKDQFIAQIYRSNQIPKVFYSGYVLDFFLLVLVIACTSITYRDQSQFVNEYNTKQNLFQDLINLKKLVHYHIGNTFLEDGVQKNYFQFSDVNSQNQLQQAINYAQTDNINYYKKIIQNILQNYQKEVYIEQFLSSQTDYTALTFVNNNFKPQTFNNTLLLANLITFQSIFTMFELPVSIDVNIYLNDLRINQIQTTDQVSEIFNEIDNDLLTNFTQQGQIYLQFIIVLSTFLIIYNILMAYFYHVCFSLKQEILSLFATINLNKIEEMTFKTKIMIKYVQNLKQKNKLLQMSDQENESFLNFIQRDENKNNIKKKNISSTTYKSNLTIQRILVGIFFSGLVLIEPVLDYYFIQIEVDSTVVNGSLISKQKFIYFFNLKKYQKKKVLCQTCMYLFEKNWLFLIQIIKIFYFLTKGNSQKLISSFSNFYQHKFTYLNYQIGTSEPTFNYTESYQQQLLTNYYEDIKNSMESFLQSYQKFSDSSFMRQSISNITEIINSSMCDQIAVYSNILQQYNQTDFDQCEWLYQGTQNSGFYISSKKFSDIQLQILNQFNTNLTSSQQQSYLQKYLESHPVSQQYYELKVLDQISQILIFLIKQQEQNLFEIINLIVIIVTLFQLILVINISYFIVKYIFQRVKLDYLNTRKFLTLIEYDIITENPYFISYLKKEI